MSKFNLFRKPVEKGSIDDWAKIAADLAKFSMVGISGVLYSNDTIISKMVAIVLLCVIIYGNLTAGRFFRSLLEEGEKK